MEANAFENVKNQIGRCGLWCGSCIVGNGALRELTRRYEHIIRGYGIDDWGAKTFDGKEFIKALTSIQTLPTCQGCLKGGGNDECKIRPCAMSKHLSDCMKCSERSLCRNVKSLQKIRTGASAVGMLMKNEEDKAGSKQLISMWTAQLRKTWPSNILFLEDK